MPGVQKPHCRASCSTNACCTGWSCSPLREPLDRRDVLAARIEREGHAARDHFAVEPDGARRARAAVATDLRAGEAELVAQHFHQRRRRIDVHSARPAVDRERQFLIGDSRGERLRR